MMVCRTNRQRGITIVMVALFIVALFAMAALAIDVGVLYTARTSAQHAADAAALAGAYTFLNPAASSDDAKAAAKAVAATNTVLGDPVSLAAGDVLVDTNNRIVTVTVRRTGAGGVSTFFAKVIGQNLVDISARAAAQASDTATGSYCTKPIYMPNSALSSPGACSGYTDTLFDASGRVNASTLGKLGTPFTLRPFTGPNVPSHYGSLNVGNNQDLRCALAQCLNQCGLSPARYSCGEEILVDTGNTTGPTRDGFNDLIGSPPDIWRGLGQYEDGSSGAIKDTSRSLIVVPVFDDCTQEIKPGKAGQRVRVLGFAAAFVDSVDGNGAQAHLVNVFSCTGSGGSGGGTGPLAVPVRLVQPPE